MIKYYCGILAVVSFCAVVNAQSYTPLSRADRREFIAAANALMLAAEEGNFAGIARFGTGIIERFQSILIDPNSRDLRPLFENVETLIRGVELRGIIDTFEVGIRREFAKSNPTAAFKIYDEFFDFLHTNTDLFDSLINSHKQVYRSRIEEFFDGQYETYNRLLMLKHVDKPFLDSLRGDIEKMFREEFTRVSSSNNIGDLFAFRARYPELYVTEINNLINSYRVRWRLNVIRRPSTDEIERFYSVFPEKDMLIDSVHQRMLFNQFVQNSDIASAMEYLTYFPNGQHARRMRMFIELQERQRAEAEQQRIIEMHRQMQSAAGWNGDD